MQYRHWECRGVSKQKPADVSCRGRRQCDRDKSSRADLREQYFDGKQHTTNWRVEGCGNTRPATGRNQRRTLPTGYACELPTKGRKGSANLDDWPFAANRSSSTDGNCRCERL